ncbi:Putative ferredoxin-NADP reductase (FNR), nucleotide-binding domain-containing protein [Colletotrichum destructivum]|uniref:Ferredoxin-NADP reductase (FNR), nucleotide-binding domain-containing protein n=1 Tax=Colletotrichum destructivum TaxID=34406 RepID=A0AAX4IZA3_9PEZI|nr:Putative ferredoxin-NADP reductase (FNR), nucleotide-binding domain-containing protein [Colletotrichum destructivum]
MSFTTSSSSVTLPVGEDVQQDGTCTPEPQNGCSELSLTAPARAYLSSRNSSSNTLVVTDTTYTRHRASPSSSSSTDVDLDDDDDEEEDNELAVPSKRGTRAYRYLRWNFGSVYRRVFTLAFLGNIAALALVVVRSLIGGPSSSSSRLTPGTCATAVSSNILAALFIRNEHTVNALFRALALLPASRTPLAVRRAFAKIYSYGGIHSGCGVASLFWFVTFLVVLTRDTPANPGAIRAYILLDSYLICALLAAIIGFAHPRARVLLHNWFEGTHRFLGWSVILLFWALVMMLAEDGRRSSSSSSSSSSSGGGDSAAEVPYAAQLVATPSFWMLIATTLLVAYPWTRLRLRDVEAEAMSDHVVKLNFNYADVHYGQAVRLTDAPLRETHAFAVIPNPAAPSSSTAANNDDDVEKALSREGGGGGGGGGALSNAGKKGFSVLVSNAGDWTAKIIKDPPKKIWTRGVPQYGVLRVAGLFEPCIVMATGSGIGPCLSLFVQRPEHPVRIVWSAQRPAETYGQAVIDALYRADPGAVIIDTQKTGRPDLVAVAYRIWDGSRRRALGLAQDDETKAKTTTTMTTNTMQTTMTTTTTTTTRSGRRTGPCEAVVIISNQKVTRKVVYGLESRGIPAYGAIFDS